MMRLVAHISDLHFGALREETIEPLLSCLEKLAPDVVAVTGDLTQRARSGQFEQAAAFLERLPSKRCLVVPGNHDIPALYRPLRRLLALRRHFDRYITSEAFPTIADEEIILVGLNTARRLSIKNGRINTSQLQIVTERLKRVSPRALRVLACHHPFVVPEGVSTRERAGRSDMAMAALIEDEVDLLLTGHRHMPWVSPLGTHLPTVHAGTATSTRIRGAENSFNAILFDADRVAVHRYVWQPDVQRFVLTKDATVEFARASSGRLRT